MSSHLDWGDGAYEIFSPALGPAANRLVHRAQPKPGERALDLGCGDGNATIPLASSGAKVTAIDPSARLLAIAADVTATTGNVVETIQGTAEAIPLEDDSVDVVISNFAVIFATKPAQALSEVLRVLAPGGRFLFTAWLPAGPLDDIRQLFQAVIPPPPGAVRSPLVWSEPATFSHLVPGGSAAITQTQAEIDFHAPSAQAFNDEQETYHPLWRAMRAGLADDAAWGSLMRNAVSALEAHAPRGERFVVRSPYVLVEVRPA